MKISVIVPVYNVEKYLSACLDSIIYQTYKNLEIILIDDESTDKSGQICDEYAKNDIRIIVIHQKNKGAGGAKNTGLDYATGEFISFVDADDYIELNMYETMLSKFNNKTDIVQCGLKKVFLNGSIKTIGKVGCFSNKEALKNLLIDWKTSLFINKLFRREIIIDIRFPVGRAIDDEFFTYIAFSNARNILVISDCFLNYRIRTTSVMNSENSLRIQLDRVDFLIERYEYICKKQPMLQKSFLKHMLTYFNIMQSQKQENNILFQKINSYMEQRSLSHPKGFLFKLKNKIITFFPQKNYNNDSEDDNYIKFQ